MNKLLENTDRFFLFFSIINMICYLLHFTNFNNEGQDYISWLVLSVITGIIAYYKDKQFEKWYAIQVMIGSFLLFAEKNFLSIGIVGLTFFLILVLAPLTYQSFGKVVLLCLAYVMMFLSMSVLLRVFPINAGLELYSVKMSAFVLPLFVLGALAVYVVWDIYKSRQRDEVKCIQQIKLMTKRVLIFAAIVVLLVLSQLLTGVNIQPTNIITKVFYYIQIAFGSNTGLYTDMVGQSGFIGLLFLILALYITADMLFAKKKNKKDVLGWQFEIIGILFLLQSFCLPQSPVIICLYMVWVLLGILHRRRGHE